MLITGVIDGPLSGGVPKAIELIACSDIDDLSVYGVESANNGNAADSPEFTFPAVSVPAGTYIYVASEEPGFTTFFGFAPTYTAGALSVNGDDAILLYKEGVVIDLFGVVGEDGSGKPWEYLDGWAYSGPGRLASTTFNPEEWTFSGKDALDGATTNAEVGNPFLTATYQCGGGGGGGGGDPEEPEPPSGPLVLAIYEIQGSGASSPVADQQVRTEGIVTGVFTGSNKLSGFFLQDATGDSDVATSDGIFVFTDDSDPGVSTGDCIRVTGMVSERFGETQISGSTLEACVSGASITPFVITDAAVYNANPEAFEGMLVTFAEGLTVTETFNLARFGEMRLSSSGKFYQPTNRFLPGSVEAAALAAANTAHSVVLDDDSNSQNRFPNPYVSPSQPRRVGDLVQELTGVVSFAFGSYKIRPTSPVVFDDSPREASPEDVGGVLKIGAFNVLNFFNGDGVGGGFPTPRGADDLEEFERQKGKIVQAIVEIDADVLGIIECENDGYGEFSAIQDLVNGVNEAIGSVVYGFVDPFPATPGASLGSDQISVGFLYKTASVKTIGDIAVMDSSVNEDFIDRKNRPCLIATFQATDGFECSTVSVCHFKSKGSSCDDVGDPSDPDGQGNCNGVRTLAANSLAQYLDTGPTNTCCPNTLIIGDLNSYAREDPSKLALLVV